MNLSDFYILLSKYKLIVQSAHDTATFWNPPRLFDACEHEAPVIRGEETAHLEQCRLFQSAPLALRVPLPRSEGSPSGTATPGSRSPLRRAPAFAFKSGAAAGTPLRTASLRAPARPAGRALGMLGGAGPGRPPGRTGALAASPALPWPRGRLWCGGSGGRCPPAAGRRSRRFLRWKAAVPAALQRAPSGSLCVCVRVCPPRTAKLKAKPHLSGDV